MKTSYLYKDGAVGRPFSGACPRKDLDFLRHRKSKRSAHAATEETQVQNAVAEPLQNASRET